MGGDPYIGQLLLVGFNFAPEGWALCAGQLMAINQNPALYNLIGTTYGGDGVNTFALPDLRGRVPVHQGAGYVIGQIAGNESVTLTLQNYPQHVHTFLAGSANANNTNPSGNAIGGGVPAFGATPTVAGQFVGGTISLAPGNSLPHENRQPFLAMNWIIALNGVYPSQN